MNSPGHDLPIAAAQQFYAAHGSDHLSADRHRLVDRCALRLIDLLGISRRLAEDIAMQVGSDIESANAAGFVDLDRCTARMVLVRDTRRGTQHMVSIGELLDLVRQRAQPHARVQRMSDHPGNSPPATG